MSTNSAVVYHWPERLLFTMAILVAGLVVGIAVIQSLPVVSQPVDIPVVVGVNVQRGLSADAARYSGWAQFALSQAGRGVTADSARYTALAKFAQDRVLKGLSADAARYSGWAEFALIRAGKGLAADSARYTALAKFAQDKALKGLAADAARYTAMAQHYLTGK